MKIAVVEDEKPIREGLVHILNKISPEYQVVGSAENGAEGLILLEEEMPFPADGGATLARALYLFQSAAAQQPQ